MPEDQEPKPIEEVEETKPWWQSKTVIGGIVTFASVIAAALGHQINEAEQAVIVEAVSGLAGAVGLVLTVWGRGTASKKITLKKAA